jgi:hypothetical protein
LFLFETFNTMLFKENCSKYTFGHILYQKKSIERYIEENSDYKLTKQNLNTIFALIKQ